MALAEADFDHRVFEQGSREDERLYVKFYRDVLRDDVESIRQARPIFKELDYIMIQAPGDLLKCVKRPARADDKTRFPRQWQAYAAGKDQDDASGTPLAHWPLVSRAQVEELAYFKIRTVEQLANVADSVVQKFMGLTALKQSAKDWLARAENSTEIVGLRADNTRQAAEIAELQAAVRELSQKITQQNTGGKSARS